MTTEQQAQALMAIKGYAIAHYEGGWDYIYECWSNAELLAELAKCGDVDATIASLQRDVDLNNEMELNTRFE